MQHFTNRTGGIPISRDDGKDTPYTALYALCVYTTTDVSDLLTYMVYKVGGETTGKYNARAQKAGRRRTFNNFYDLQRNYIFAAAPCE